MRSDPPNEQLGPSVRAEDLVQNLRAIAEYAWVYLETYLDRGKLTLKSVLLEIVLTILALTVLGGAILIGLVFLLYGFSLGIIQLNGGRNWLGFSLSGVFLLLLAWLIIRYSIAKLKSVSLSRRIESYQDQKLKPKQKNGSPCFDYEKKLPTN